MPHSLYLTCYFLTEPFWFQHFHVLAVPKQFQLEVEGGAEVEGEDAVL